MNDFVVQEQVCNLRCTYCLNFENELKGDKPWVPSERIALDAGTKGFDRALESLRRCRELTDAPILRISGGEIFAIGGGLEFIERVASEWAKIQVLTNATLLTEATVARLAAIPGINLCCSVDGHTMEANALRTKHAKWASRIIDGMLNAVAAGIPVEVNTVVTRCNEALLYEFAHWLLALSRTADLRFMPFPVRGKVAETERVAVTSEVVASLRRIIADYAVLEPVLPPVGYLQRMERTYVTRKRTDRCRVSLAYLASFDDGTVAACTNCWASSLGNILTDDTVFDKVGNTSIYKLFLRDPPRFPFCDTCFTPFDAVNVYFDGDCSLEQLARMDLYASDAVRDRLALLHAAWRDGGASPVLSMSAEVVTLAV